jgi:Endoplasmic Reticulum-Golgi Intermediate Compartment (ERGIC)
MVNLNLFIFLIRNDPGCLIPHRGSRWVMQLSLDNNKEERIRINFNITLMDLRCDWAVVDSVSSFGTEQNLTAHVTKWHMDANGIRQRFQGRNKQQHDIHLFDGSVVDTVEELLKDGEDAISLDESSFSLALQEYKYLFVDFYAPWCSHVRQ